MLQGDDAAGIALAAGGASISMSAMAVGAASRLLVLSREVQHANFEPSFHLGPKLKSRGAQNRPLERPKSAKILHKGR